MSKRTVSLPTPCGRRFTPAAEVATALRNAGAKQVLLAGRPGDREGAWREAGVGAFIYARCDAIETLEGLHAVLEVRK